VRAIVVRQRDDGVGVRVGDRRSERNPCSRVSIEGRTRRPAPEGRGQISSPSPRRYLVAAESAAMSSIRTPGKSLALDRLEIGAASLFTRRTGCPDAVNHVSRKLIEVLPPPQMTARFRRRRDATRDRGDRGRFELARPGVVPRERIRTHDTDESSWAAPS